MFWEVENWRISFALNDHICTPNIDSYLRTGDREIRNRLRDHNNPNLKKNLDLSHSYTEEFMEQDDIEGNYDKTWNFGESRLFSPDVLANSV